MTRSAGSPSISIITVTLNASKYLPRLFESIRQQTDRDFHHIVLDGASSDGTQTIIQANADLLKHWASEPDFGLYDALNKAINVISTDYYLVVGADDVLAPTAIEAFRRTTVETGADIVIANVRAGGKLLRGYHPKKAWLGHALMITSHSVGTLIRTSLHKRFGRYPYRYPTLADGYFIKRACLAPTTKTVAANFVAGEFGTTGRSRRNIARALCESWHIQIDTGEHPFVQYVLFQLRVFRNLYKILTLGKQDRESD